MLSILGEQSHFCDGIPRRSFLRIGGLALGGLSLPQLLRAESAGGGKPSEKAIINIFLPGGPPHQDMFDLKPDAPREYRGEFVPIRTNVSGIEICELFPRMARMMDKLAIIRSVVGSEGSHDAYQCQSGRVQAGQPTGGWPSVGAVLSKLRGSRVDGMPPFVGLAPKMRHQPWSNPGQAGFLGPAHAAFRPGEDGTGDMVLNGVTLERLHQRRSLLSSFDRFRRETDASGVMEGLDNFSKQAFGILTSSRLVEAFELEREDPRTLERYGTGSREKVKDGSYRRLDEFLLARRLIEAGVRCVTLAFSRWDWHGGNFKRAREDFPMLDQGVTSLVEDLHDRGLDRDVTVVVWGEFGRTPLINRQAGRDHWPKVSCALLAGGGLRTGQVIGSTTPDAGEAKDRPVHFQEIFATLYNRLGIDAANTEFYDLDQRPQFLVRPNMKPIAELI